MVDAQPKAGDVVAGRYRVGCPSWSPRLGLLLAITLGAIDGSASLASADETKASCIDANARAQDSWRNNRFSDARAQLRRCADATCPELVRDDCAKRLDDLGQAQPTIIFEVKDQTGNDVPAVAISVDGQPLAGAAPGTEVAVDPGTHSFTFELKEGKAGAKLVIVEGIKMRRVPVVMTPAGVTSTTPDAGATKASGPPVLLWVAFGVGAAGLVVGGVAGALGFADAGSAKGHCNGNACTPPAQSPINDAKSMATISDIGFVVAGVGTAVGVGLLVWGRPEHSTPSASLVVGPYSLRVEGTW